MDYDSSILKNSISRLPDIKRLDLDIKNDITELCTETVGAVVPLVSAITPIVNLYGHYKERKFAKRAIFFLSTLAESDIPQKKIDKFIEELSKHTHENGYDTIVGMIDRLDNENKAQILSNLVRFCAEGRYSKSDFLRVANALERVPYSDLYKLPNYVNDYYEPGESEILYASGLISQTNIDSGHWDNGDDGGTKYGLSKLGEDMLHYGFVFHDYKYQGDGVQVHAENLKWKEID